MKYLFLGGNFHVVFGIFNSILVIHRVLSGRVLGLIVGSIYCHQIAAYLNCEGMSSSTGKRFCTELVFEVIQKTLMQAQCMAYAMAIPEIRFAVKLSN